MDVLFICSKLKFNPIELDESELKKLPKKLFIAYTIQFQDFVPELKSKLKKTGISVVETQQVLGCSQVNTKYPILLLTQGKFHVINLYTQSNEIFITEGNSIKKVPLEEINKIRAKRKSALIKFLSAEKVGILVSTKPGQENLEKAMKLTEKLNSQGKKSYIFLANNLDIAQFENFQIDSWVNTACPGLAFDNPSIININEIK
jgi:2-(3-amino-3-carboxypropyl)histidine synthase